MKVFLNGPLSGNFFIADAQSSAMKNYKLGIMENHPLSGLTTFETGGPARYFAPVSSETEIIRALEFACDAGVPVFVLGGGSNLLVSDAGFPGLVIHNRIKGVETQTAGDKVIVSAGAGESWQGFVDRCVAAGLQGVECLAGIPGTVGASPAQNIGAYGQDVSEAIVGVRAVETDSGCRVRLGRDACKFAYRSSVFNSCCPGKYIITAVDYRLAPGGSPDIRYAELERRLHDDADISIAGVRDAIMSIRDSKGLLVGEGGESFRSAGSFFRNPVVSAEAFGLIDERVRRAGGCNEWAWPMEDGRMKISAACLIQLSGFSRGHRSGNAGISPRHTLIIINYGGATGREIADFAALVQNRVFDEFGVFLLPEVRLVGFPDNTLRQCI
jgi:UDP-N-acetylmuramate dehydrogenase